MDGKIREGLQGSCGLLDNGLAFNEGRAAGCQSRKILITGCGRSGTRYVSCLIGLLGLDVGHERMGRDGIASWYMAVASDRSPFGPASADYLFQTTLHQVRHPLAVIPSTLSFKGRSWDYICENLGLDPHQEPLRLGLTYWYSWNLRAGQLADWRYRIEDIADVFPEFCDRLGVPPDPKALDAISPDVNTRRYGRIYHLVQETCIRTRWLGKAGKIMHQLEQGSASRPPKLSWSDLSSLDPLITRRARELAHSYGYVY